MKTFTKRIASAALAIGLVGGAGLVSAGPAAADSASWSGRTMEQCKWQSAQAVKNVKDSIRRAGGGRINYVQTCKLDRAGQYSGKIHYTLS